MLTCCSRGRASCEKAACGSCKGASCFQLRSPQPLNFLRAHNQLVFIKSPHLRSSKELCVSTPISMRVANIAARASAIIIRLTQCPGPCVQFVSATSPQVDHHGWLRTCKSGSPGMRRAAPSAAASCSRPARRSTASAPRTSPATATGACRG